MKSAKVVRVIALLLAASTLLLLSQFVFHEGVVHTATHEIGFALLVSVVIWGLFEAQLSQEAEAIWDLRMERATKNVFQAVLRKDLPKGLLDEANNLVLNSCMIRSGFTVTYTLNDSTFDAGVTGATDCVLVEAVMEFSMQNVSTDIVTWQVAVGLPNPIHPDLKHRVGVRTVTVMKGGEAVVFDLEAAQERFRQDILDNSKTAVVFRPGQVALEPGESCNFSASYVMAKEAEDSELLQTLYPADGLRVTIFDQAGDGRRVTFAQSVHRHGVENISEGQVNPRAKIFKIPGYLLPHQGVLIWWKRNPEVPEAAAVPLLRE